MSGIRHMKAGEVNEMWIGYRLTCRNRRDGRMVEGGLSDFQQFANPAETRLFMGGQTVELRADDTVTAGSLDVPGAA